MAASDVDHPASACCCGGAKEISRGDEVKEEARCNTLCFYPMLKFTKNLNFLKSYYKLKLVGLISAKSLSKNVS